MQNREQQDEELAALEAIYADDCTIDTKARTVQVHIPSKGHSPCIILNALLVDGYPSETPPALEITADHLSEDTISQACSKLEDLFVPGEVVIYNWVEWLTREYLLHQLGAAPGEQTAGVNVDDEESEEDEDWEPGEEDDNSSESSEIEFGAEHDELEGKQGTDSGTRRGAESARGITASLLDSVRSRIVSGEPSTERKSTFQAHVARVHSPEEAMAVVEVLLENNKIRNATHNIMAYRISCEGRDTFHADCDDDGEAAAGGRLLHLLQVADARDVVVVVSRWFGGVLLGPSRFTFINNTARQLLEKEGFIKSGSSNTKGSRSQGPNNSKQRSK